jgi:hypothetical protein
LFRFRIFTRCSLTWTFDDIPQSGNYVVQAHWIGHSNRTNAAPYTINDENGATVVVVNQKTGVATCSSSGFQTLGTFEFNEGGTYTVTLPAVASGYVSADAVKLIFVENQPTVTAVNTAVADATYVGGQDIDLTVEFSEEVNVTGTPRILLNSGAYANYLSGSGTNTLTFRYTVGADEESTDLDYSATNSLELNGGTIQDISTNDADLTLPAVGTFAGVHAIVIDAKAPAVPSLVSPTDGTYTTTAGLTSIDWTDEADMSGPVTYYYQSAFDSTVGAENALTSPIYTSGVLGTSDIPTGGTGAGVYYYQFRSCDAVGNCSDWSGPFVVTVDNTAPVLTVNNDVEVGPVASDTVNVSVTETNPDAATFEYGFSADAVCDVTDTFGNAFVDGADFAITDETNNGNYICLKASDLSGNTTYQLSANVLNVDATDPTIGAVSVVTDFDPFVRGNGTGFQIRMNALDLNGIATCEYSLDNGATWTAGFYNAAPAVDRCQANNVTAPDTQVLTITMRATDTLGNESIGTAIVRTADSANPVVTAFTVNPSIGGFTTANPVLDFTITDNLSDINRCQYRYRITGSGAAGWSAWTNGSLIGTGTSVSCLETITGLTDGVSYDFQVRGRDGVNHNSAVSSINGLVVDANMTSTVFTSPANGSAWNTAIDLDGISTDNVGVDYVELYYSDDNGATWNLITTLDNAANNSPFNWSYDWTPVLEGEYDLQAIGFDTVGNESTADAFDVVYDVTAPAIPNPISPVDGYITKGVAFTQTWDTIADATLYRYQSCHVNPGDAGAACPDVRYTNTYATPSKFVGAGQPNGQFWWRVQARDAAGNWSAYGESFEMIIDNSAPVVTLDAHTPDPTNSTTLNYTGNAADVYLAGVESVEYRYSDDGGATWTAWSNANATDGTFDSVNEDFNFSFTVAADDIYTVQVRATDFAGNVSLVVSDEVTVDTTKPVVSFDGFRDQFSPIYDNAQPINVCGSINSTGFIAWEWTLTSVEPSTVTYTYTITAGPTAVGYTIDTTSTHYNGGIPMEGTYTVEVFGTDAAGNVGDAVSCEVTYDATNPVTVLNAHVPNPTTDNTPSFTGTATDNLTNIATVEYRYSDDGGATWTAWTAATADDAFDSTSEGFNFTAGALSDGNYIFEVRATDAGGNVETITDDASRQLLQIDTTAPIVTANTTAANQGPVSGTIAETVEISDDGLGDLNIAGATATYGSLTPVDTLDSDTETFDWIWDTTTAGGDGIYTITICGEDALGNTGTGSSTTLPTVLGDECYSFDVEVDNTAPVVTNPLADAIYNEGDAIPAMEIDVTDNNDLKEMCAEVTSSPIGAQGPSCLSDGGLVDNTAFTWDLTDLISYTLFDTSILPEGDYEISYSVEDEAGNKSTDNFTITVENVAPVVTLTPAPDQTVNEGEAANFTGSFIDSASVDMGDGIFDDANWTVTVDYGDGTVTSLPSVSSVGAITIPDHTYANADSSPYTVTLTVCEDGQTASILTTGEGECHFDEVEVIVNNVLPVVSIDTNPGDSTTLQAITMTADVSANTQPGNQVVSYSWGNGNFAGCTGTGASVTTPSTPGSYTCEVTVTDVDGDTATAIKTVVVNPNPIVDASPTVIIIANSPATGGTGTVNVAAGTNFTLSAVTSSGNASFDYVFSGTCSGNTSNTGTTFSTNVMNLAAGTYTCFVTVTDNDGDTASASVPIVVSGGVGAGGVLGDNTDNEDNDNDEDSEEDEEGSVLGAQTCEETETLTGNVYLDVNENGTQDSDEDGLSGITVSVYYTDEDGERKFLRSIDTDSEGKYEFELCAGEYEIEVSRNDLESGNVLSENVQDVTLTLDTDVEGIDFEVVESDDTAESADSEDNEFNWLYVIIPVIVLLVLLLLYLASRNRGSKGQDVDFV